MTRTFAIQAADLSIDRAMRSARTGRAGLMIGTALATLAMLPTAAQGQSNNACGAPVDGVVTCRPAGNPYGQGIQYETPLDLTVALQEGVAVVVDPALIGVNGITLIRDGEGLVRLTGGAGTSVTTSSLGQYGVAGGSLNGGSADLQIGSVNTSGDYGVGVAGTATGTGDIAIDVRSVVTSGTSSDATKFTIGNGGDASVRAGTLSTSGSTSYGVLGRATGSGSINVDVGSIRTKGYGGVGVDVRGATHDINAKVQDLSTVGVQATGVLLVGDDLGLTVGSVGTTGDSAPGILLFGGTSSTVTGTSITTAGSYSDGAELTARSRVTATIDRVSVSGGNANGVSATASAAGGSVDLNVANVTMTGPNTNPNFHVVALNAFTPLGGTANITSTGQIIVAGDRADGVAASSFASTIQVNNLSVNGSGFGILAYARSMAKVTLTGNLDIVGDPLDATGAAILVDMTRNQGVINPIPTGQFATVINNGTITTSGTRRRGIRVMGIDDVSITGSGSIETDGLVATGILAYGQRNITIDQASVVTNDQAFAIVAEIQRAGTGNISVRAGNVATRAALADYATSTGVLTYAYSGSTTIDLGNVSTVADGAHGVEANGLEGGDITVRIGTGSTLGDGANVVRATASIAGDIAIETGTLSTAGDSSAAVRARTIDGAIRVTTNGLTQTSGQDSSAIDAFSTGTGSVTITGNGPVRTSGPSTFAIDARSRDGNVTVTANEVTASGAGSKALYASAGSAAAVTTNGPVTSGGTGITIYGHGGPATLALNGSLSSVGRGIEVYGDSAATVTAAGTVTTTGSQAEGIVVGSANGDARVTAASVSTQGFLAGGVRVLSASGNAVANIGNISTSGAGATGVYANSVRGNTNVTSTGTIAVTGQGASAINARALRGTATVNVNNASNAGTSAPAVSARGANAEVTVNGTVSSTGRQLSNGGAVLAYAAVPTGPAVPGGAGRARVTNNGTIATRSDYNRGIVVNGATSAIVAGSGSITTDGVYAAGIFATGAGEISVAQGNVTTRGEDSRGVAVLHTGTTGRVGVNVGNVATLTNRTGVNGAIGIATRTTGAETAIRAGSVTTAAANALGIRARSTSGAITIEADSVATTGAGATGISAMTGGMAPIAITARSVTTSGANAAGISAATDGRITIALTDGATSGPGSTLISAQSTLGQVNVTSTGTLRVSGDGSALISPSSGNAVTVSVNNAFISGAGTKGINAQSQTTSSVTVSGTITDTATSATLTPAVQASSVGQATVTNNGLIVTTGNLVGGVYVSSQTGAALAGTGSISTAGDRTFGAYASAAAGLASLTQGSITTTGNTADAAVARSFGTTSVNVGTLRTSGTESFGVFTEGQLGATATIGSVTTTGDRAEGVRVRSYGAASATVGTATTSGQGSRAIAVEGGTANLVATGATTATGAAGVTQRSAILAAASAGAANIRVASVTASGAGMSAIVGQATGAIDLNVTGGTVRGAVDAVDLTSGASSTITNAGTIQGGSGAAIRVVGGPATISSSGTIIGQILLTGFDDAITSSGTLTLGAGSSLGAGNDVLTSSGTLVLGTGAVGGAASFDSGAGSDTLRNNGILTFAAHSAPVTMTLIGLESFANSGAIDLRNGIAGDSLAMPGSFAGTGASSLLFDVVDGATPRADTLVIGGAATGSTQIALAFVGNAQPSLVQNLTLVQAASGTAAGAFSLAPSSMARGLIAYGLNYDPATSRFALVGVPGGDAVRLLKLSEGAQTVWLASADAVSAQLDSQRDIAWSGARASGGRIWGQGFGRVASHDQSRAFTTFGFTQATAFDYRQDEFGGQLGAGLIGDDSFALGVTGGYVSSTLRFQDSGERFDYGGVNLGLYASFRAGGAFVNALAKYDRYDIKVRIPFASVSQGIDGDGYGGRIEAGYRIGGAGFYAEPRVALSYTRTDIDPLAAAGARADFEDMEGLRGSIGLRIGGRSTRANGDVIAIYAGGEFVREFEGKDGIDFTTGATSVGFRNAALGDYGKGVLGVTIGSGRVSGFFEGNAIAGKNQAGGGGRAGIRVAF